MASCECCWSASRWRAHHGTDRDEYSKTMAEHAARQCECAKPTKAGDIARAGQFWDDVMQMDKRYTEAEWAAMHKTQETPHA